MVCDFLALLVFASALFFFFFRVVVHGFRDSFRRVPNSVFILRILVATPFALARRLHFGPTPPLPLVRKIIRTRRRRRRTRAPSNERRPTDDASFTRGVTPTAFLFSATRNAGRSDHRGCPPDDDRYARVQHYKSVERYGYNGAFESSRKTSYLKSKQHRLTSKKEALIIEQNLSTKCALTQ